MPDLVLHPHPPRWSRMMAPSSSRASSVRLWSRCRRSPRARYVVSALRHRGRDVTDTALEFDGTPGESLEIVLTNRTATLAGVVRDSAGPVVASAVVICFPIDSQRWAHFAPCRAKVSSDGSWKLPSLVTGELPRRGAVDGRCGVARLAGRLREHRPRRATRAPAAAGGAHAGIADDQSGPLSEAVAGSKARPA